MIDPKDWGFAAPEDWFDPKVRISSTELMALFDRSSSEARFLTNADSQEYLAVVMYLVKRNKA